MTESANGPAELRDAVERATARADAAESELRALRIETVFKEAEVPKASASLFQGDEITVEIVQAWASEHGIVVGTPTETPKVAEAVPGAEAVPEGGRAPAIERITADGPQPAMASIASAAGSQQATVGAAIPHKMSHADFSSMLENPATRTEAERAYIEGRVERHPGNVQADQAQAKGLLR